MQDNQPLHPQHERIEKKGEAQKKVKSYQGIAWLFIVLLLFGLGAAVIWNQAKIFDLKRLLEVQSKQISDLQSDQLEIKKTQSQTQQDTKTYNQYAQIPLAQTLSSLVSLAQQYLTLQKNIPLAVQSLRLAQARVDLLPEDSRQTLKEALHQEIQKLEAIETSREMLIAEQLNHLALAVEPLSVSQNFPKETSPQTSSTPHENRWIRFKQSLTALLKKAIVIQHDPLEKTHTSIPNAAYLKSQIQLNLLKTQWALFQHQETSYRQNLDAVITSLKRYFVQDANQQSMLTALENLKNQPINPSLPDLSSLLVQIQSLSGTQDSSTEKKTKPDDTQALPLEKVSS